MTDDPILKALKALKALKPIGTAVGERPAQAEPAFAAEGTLPLGALSVDVAGLGRLSPALSPGQATALHASSTPAHHGQRERTLLDTRVRHTGEIGADRVALHWGPGAF